LIINVKKNQGSDFKIARQHSPLIFSKTISIYNCVVAIIRTILVPKLKNCHYSYFKTNNM